jgi:hypothetical protein
MSPTISNLVLERCRRYNLHTDGRKALAIVVTSMAAVRTEAFPPIYEVLGTHHVPLG